MQGIPSWLCPYNTSLFSPFATLIAGPDGNLYATSYANGNTSGTFFMQWNPGTDTWTPKSMTGTGAVGMGAQGNQAILGLPSTGKLLYVGPVGTATTFLYTPSSNSWTATGTCTSNKTGAALVLNQAGTKVYAFGGINNTGAVAVYTIATGVWAASAVTYGATTVSNAYDCVATTLLPSGNILLIDYGSNAASTTPTYSIFVPGATAAADSILVSGGTVPSRTGSIMPTLVPSGTGATLYGALVYTFTENTALTLTQGTWSASTSWVCRVREPQR
jgi:hypothetical protein